MKKLLRVLQGEAITPPPVWLMRQAGRYLPEYRALRQQANGFLDLCYNPQLACEITLQPVRRFGFDAAILFSDILVVPHALGVDVRFEEGKGPLLAPLAPEDTAYFTQKARENISLERLSASFETIHAVKKQLASNTSLIGFCGAPWTVATYMIAGHGTVDQAPARAFLYRYPHEMQLLLDLLADVSADYLIGQIEAGADVVQIFDSWAGVLDEPSFATCAIAPVRRMVARIRLRFPHTPIIAFARGAGLFYQTYASQTGVNALGLDWAVPLSFAACLQEQCPVQGNLDPLRLVAGGKALSQSVQAILQALEKKPFIFNLGHGILPQTPLSHVEQLLDLIRDR